MGKSKNKKSSIIPIIAVVLVVVLIFSGYHLISSLFSYNKAKSDKATNSKTITRNDKTYYPRQDITVLMLTGIDQNGPVKASSSYNNEGEADMISLAVFDESEKTFNILVLNRDTMLNVPVLGIGGKPAGTSYEQLALSHTYGTGMEDSCENTRKAVSDFLYGLNIDYYLSMNMDAISILNDAVGGVTVNVTDDFSAVDPTITKGQFTLKGDQAITFIQTRKDIGDQMNISRMERHTEFMSGFIKAFKNQLENDGDSFVYNTYTAIDEYMVTDVSVNTMSNLVKKYADYQLEDIIVPEGENIAGADYMEFHADEDKLDSLILNLFYAEK